MLPENLTRVIGPVSYCVFLDDGRCHVDQLGSWKTASKVPRYVKAVDEKC